MLSYSKNSWTLDLGTSTALASTDINGSSKVPYNLNNNGTYKYVEVKPATYSIFDAVIPYANVVDCQRPTPITENGNEVQYVYGFDYVYSDVEDKQVNDDDVVGSDIENNPQNYYFRFSKNSNGTGVDLTLYKYTDSSYKKLLSENGTIESYGDNCFLYIAGGWGTFVTSRAKNAEGIDYHLCATSEECNHSSYSKTGCIPCGCGDYYVIEQDSPSISYMESLPWEEGLVAIDSYSLNVRGTYTFDEATADYTTAPDALIVTVRNTGSAATDELAVTLSSVDAFELIGTRPIPSIEPNGTATFTVAPKTGLAAGTYTATVTVGTGEKAQSFDVSFTVNAPSTPPVTTPKLIFDANGGGGTMDDLTVYTTEVNGNGTVYVFELPECDFTPPVVGMQFAGWKVFMGTEVFPAGGTFRIMNPSITLYAEWKDASTTPATYTVSFDANGGSGFMSAQTFTKDVAKALTENAFTRDGYAFAGWNTAVNGSGTSYADKQSVIIGATCTLYAQWTENSTPTPPPSTPSSKPKYPAKLTEDADVENGEVSFSQTRVKAGRTVTITVTPDTGYALDKLVILDRDGDEVTFKDNGDGTFTFTMPSGGVEVEPFFEKIKADEPATEQKDMTMVLYIDQPAYLLNDTPMMNDAAPTIRGERTMLPIRVVAKALGATVAWSEADQTVTIVKGDLEIMIYIGESFALVNGSPVELDSAAFIANDRTYLPLRFVAENLGATVNWDGNANIVTIILK